MTQFHLTAAQREFFAENGFVHLSGVFSASECAAIRSELHAWPNGWETLTPHGRA